MRVIYSALTALAVLNFGVEARIGSQRQLQFEGELFLDVVGDNGDFPDGPLTLCQGECDTDEDVSFCCCEYDVKLVLSITVSHYYYVL
jgi:hypothetical protein